jgi:hypothetical protein
MGYAMKTLEEMKRRLKEIEDQGSHWKKLGDGNYDLYLIDNGYKQLHEDIIEMEKQLETL